MSLEHSLARDGDHNYWHSLIDEQVAAEFADVSVRTVQAWRRTGEGPSFIRLSARCIRYTRATIRDWAEEKRRKSTSDPGPLAA